MIRVAVKQGLLGEQGTDHREVEYREGMTLHDLRVQVCDSFPMLDVVAAVDGHELHDADLLPDGSTVVVCVRTDYTLLGYVVYALISAIVALAVNYVASLLSPTPKPPGVPQDRGDSSSPTYSWDAIQTSYGQGQTIAVVFGRHAIGGQVIGSTISWNYQGFGAGVQEVLIVDLALCEGPIHAIGDQKTNRQAIGALPGIGTSPWDPVQTGLYINDNLIDSGGVTVPNVITSLRLGQLNQSAVGPGAQTLIPLNQPLNDVGDDYVWTYTDNDDVVQITFVVSFPGGLYSVGAGGAQVPYAVQFEMGWRYVGESAWRNFTTVAGGQYISFSLEGPGGFRADTRTMNAGVPVTGPFQIRLHRITGGVGSATQDITGALWRSLTLVRPQEFAYPGIAHQVVAIGSSATFSGGLPRFKQVVDGTPVQVWSEESGLSEPFWDPPTTGAFTFSTLTGRNPAWVLGAYLMNARWGAGNEIGYDRIDWPALRRWSIYCQDNPTGWSDPRYTCDLVLDSSRPTWETVVRICWCGGAAPMWKGGKVSVVYQYRDAHSDSGVSVPAKAPVQLLNNALVRNVQVEWLPKVGRATAIDYQYLDEDQGYAQNVLQVEDTESNVQDPNDPQSEPFVAQTIQAYGVTRQTQLIRMGFRTHRQTRLIRRQLSFECGPWLLAAEVGDLFDFQHDMLRPFSKPDDSDSIGTAMQVVSVTGTADFRCVVDHEVDADDAANLLLALALRMGDGSPVYTNIDSATPTTYRGRAATLITFVDSIDVPLGASCLVGFRDELVETYQVVAITLGEDMVRQVKALQWVPEIFDQVDDDQDSKGYDTAKLTAPKAEDNDPQPVLAEELRVLRTENGRQVVSWQPPAESTKNNKLGRLARVHYRDEGNFGEWIYAGETSGNEFELRTPTNIRAAEVSVALSNHTGDFTGPDASTKASIVVPEFPQTMLPPPHNLEMIQQNEANRLSVLWSAVDSSDVIAYEIRAGEHWAAAPIVWRGSSTEAVLQPAPAMGTLQIAAVHRTGLYGQRTKFTRTVTELPAAGAAKVDSSEYAPTAGTPTHSGTQFSTDLLELTASSYLGTVTTQAVDLGYEAAFFLRVALEVREKDNATVADLENIEAGSGEALWRTVDTRPASPLSPGINWRLSVEDVEDTPVDQLVTLQASGLQVGEVGANVDAFVESRTYFDGAWGEWQPHRDRTEICQQWQARVRLGRRFLEHDVQLTTFRLETLL